ncbi:hypothetical protein ABBQ38_007022 [Trebouxia sp. C0009 RCD-2024]
MLDSNQDNTESATGDGDLWSAPDCKGASVPTLGVHQCAFNATIQTVVVMQTAAKPYGEVTPQSFLQQLEGQAADYTQGRVAFLGPLMKVMDQVNGLWDARSVMVQHTGVHEVLTACWALHTELLCCFPEEVLYWGAMMGCSTRTCVKCDASIKCNREAKGSRSPNQFQEAIFTRQHAQDDTAIHRVLRFEPQPGHFPESC